MPALAAKGSPGYRPRSASSAEETLTSLRLAVAWGHLQAVEVAKAVALLDRVLAITWRLVH